MIYFDHAATSLQKPLSVGYAMARALGTLSDPGRGGHKAAMSGAETAYQAREAIAKLFRHDEPEGVVFCMNATHALNIAIKNLARKDSRVVISGYEHNAVVRPLYALGARIEIAASGIFCPEEAIAAFERALLPGTELAVINHISNVFGYIQPVYEIAELCRQRGIPFILDASQSAGCAEIDFNALGAAYIAMPGHKGLYGPQGTGILLCGSKAHPNPLLEGGSGSNSKQRGMPDFLPDRLEAGTHNMPGIAGLYEGVKFVLKKGPINILHHEKRLMKALAERLSSLKGIRVFTTPDGAHQSGVLSFQLTGISAEQVASRLSDMGIAVRAGLHCAPLAHDTAGTLASGTVRASFSIFNTMEEVEAFASAVQRILMNQDLPVRRKRA